MVLGARAVVVVPSPCWEPAGGLGLGRSAVGGSGFKAGARQGPGALRWETKGRKCFPGNSWKLLTEGKKLSRAGLCPRWGRGSPWGALSPPRRGRMKLGDIRAVTRHRDRTRDSLLARASGPLCGAGVPVTPLGPRPPAPN